MLRTPPRAIASFSRLPLPESPETHTDQACDAPTQNAGPNSGAPAPHSLDLPHSGDGLSDEEIMKQIKNLQKLLKERRKKAPAKRNLGRDSSSDEDDRASSRTPADADTSFCSTASLVRTVCNSVNKKRKGSSSPSSHISPRRFKVAAQINAAPKSPNPGAMVSDPSPNSGLRTVFSHQRQENLDRIEVVDSMESVQRGVTSVRSQRLHADKGGAPNTSRAISSLAHKASESAPSAASADKIPPIVLRDKTNWARISTEIKRRGINFVKAQNIPDGIRIFPSTEADYRAITKFFSNDSIPYHTYQLPSEKLLNVVLRGIPVEVAVEEIFKDLRELGFTPELVVRMRRTRDKAPMPLVLVKVPRAQKAIYHLTEVVSLEISVETLKAKSSIGQCFRCQKFGHAQSRCTAPRRCVACAEEHPPSECPRLKTEPATCANCKGEHPANYRGCERFPRPRVVRPASEGPPSARTYSQVAAGNSQGPPPSGGRKTQSKSPANSSSKTPSKPPSRSPGGHTPRVRIAVPRDAGEETADDNLVALLGALQDLFSHVDKITAAITRLIPQAKNRHGRYTSK